MSCGRFERLLALDAGCDLGATDARSLAAHLETCAPCRRAAEEFADARALLLDACEPPEFDGAFYESVRRGVMRELGAAPPPSGVPVFFRRLFSAPAYAAALAVLVLVAALALVLRTRDTGEAGGQTREVVVRDEGQQPSAPAATPDTSDSNVVAPPPSPVAPARERVVRKGTQTAGFRRRSAPPVEVRREAPTVTPPVDETQETAALNAAGPDADEERRMLRIELQTSDPNVRIIWLTPERSDRR